MADINQMDEVDRPEEVQIRLIQANRPLNKPPSVPKDGLTSDNSSLKGHFGWHLIDEKQDIYIPYIFRNNEKYCAVRMVEKHVVAQFNGTVHYELYCSCINIPGYFITDTEKKLLNEINSFHCDFEYGKLLFTQQDCIIRLEDAVEFKDFLNVCYYKLLKVKNASNKCGFYKIDYNATVPFVEYNGEEYLPLFYFEGAEHLNSVGIHLKGWHLAYLKFCFKIQGIRDEFIKQDSILSIKLSDVKGCFPPDTDFHETWPENAYNSRRNTNTYGRFASRQWVTLPQVVNNS